MPSSSEATSSQTTLLPQRPVSGVPLIERVRRAIRARHYSRCTEDAYVQRIKRCIVYHGKRHPLDMGRDHVIAFLTALAVDRRMSASSQNQALSALLFLYKVVLEREIARLTLSLARARLIVCPSCGASMKCDRSWRKCLAQQD